MTQIAPLSVARARELDDRQIGNLPFKREEYSIVELVFSFFKEKIKDVVKLLGYSTFWAGQAVPNLPSSVQSFSFAMSDVKNLLGAIEIPEKANALQKSVSGLWTSVTDGASWTQVANAGRKAIKDTTGFVNSCCDGIDFSTKYITIDKSALTGIKTVSFGSTLVGASIAAGEQLYNLGTEPDPEGTKWPLYLMNLARDVSYVALGIIGLASIITATPLVAWQILACLTSGLLFSIGGFFYNGIVDPEKQGKSLNPEALVHNAAQIRKTAPTV